MHTDRITENKQNPNAIQGRLRDSNSNLQRRCSEDGGGEIGVWSNGREGPAIVRSDFMGISPNLRPQFRNLNFEEKSVKSKSEERENRGSLALSDAGRRRVCSSLIPMCFLRRFYKRNALSLRFYQNDLLIPSLTLRLDRENTHLEFW